MLINNTQVNTGLDDALLATQLARFPQLSYYVTQLRAGTLCGHGWNNLGMIVQGLALRGQGSFGLARIYIAQRAMGR